MRHAHTVTIAAAIIALAVSLPAVAAKKEKKVDRIWVHATFDSFKVERIAMLPAASYDKNSAAEQLVEGTFGQAIKGAGYRWISPLTTRELLRSSTGGTDSLLNLAKKSMLDAAQVDSVLAIEICNKLHVDALLEMRIDQWEKRELEYDQSGKSSTSIQIKAALMDSTGALLWTASGGQSADGPYHDANAGAIGLSGGSLTRSVLTGQGGAPEYLDVLNLILARWTPQFPSRTQPAKTP
jgi:hypothetical protein